MNNTISRMLALTCFVAGVGIAAASCSGNDNNENNGAQCGDDQTFATVNGVEKCYDNCVEGACDAGFSCQEGLCLAGNNGTTTNNGTETNNGTTATNNGTTATNNGTTATNNGTTATNNGTTNNGDCEPLNPSIGPCDPLCQTGCADGEACIAGTTGPGAPLASLCQPAGTAQAGDTCDQMTACAEGLGCFTSDGTTFACQEFCRTGGGEPSCTGNAVCSPFDQNEQRVGICVVPSDECTQYPNDSCPNGQNCYLTNQGLRCLNHSTTAMPGDACASPTDCGDAQGCISDGTNNTCAAFCEPNNAMCAVGEQCAQLQGLTYGACVTP